MAILKKPEPKKRACQCPPPVTGGISGLMGAARTLAPTPEESAMRREMNRLQVEMMKADLRLHDARADMAEFAAARAHAELKDYLAQRAKLAKK
ncbi:MAG: hypothetical protein BWY57_03115 [Betaproteobacteria bacterium ADurb.Bin341]|nr:MAG: hypothetical protein BWY57_03115 [Betaproteobacteria bacterium ADurb.Bin341]